MAQQTRLKSKKVNMPSWLKGAFIAIMISVSFVFLMPLFVLNGQIDMDITQYIFLIIQGISVFVGSYTANRQQQSNKLMVCALVAGIYLLLMLMIAIALFDGVSGLIWGGVVSCAVGVVCAAFVSSKRNNRAIGKRRRNA